MSKLNSFQGDASLSIGHMAGMIDLAALPLWVGVLMQYYQLPPERAGLTITMFLGAVVLASCLLAPQFHRLHHRAVAVSGFAVAALSFFATSRLFVGDVSFQTLLILHAVAGLGAGSGLSVSHGLMGRTVNPHRLFGIANVTMGALAIVMFAVLPGIIRQNGGHVLFEALALIMAFASACAVFFYPSIEKTIPGAATRKAEPRAPLSPAVWPVIGVIICLAMNQAMIFSFVERIGVERGFGEERVQIILVVMGFINLAPGLLAALLQNRLSATTVGTIAPILQATFAVSLTGTTYFPLYAAPMAFFVCLVIFTHVFLFGLLSKIDKSGRAVAATPAMMMFGSALGPALGGAIVAGIGYRGLGWAAVLIASLALVLILLARRLLAQTEKKPAMVSA